MAEKTPEQLSRRLPRSLSDAELGRELEWHEERAALLRRHLKSRNAAAASAARRKATQLDLARLWRVYEEERAANTYGAVLRTAKRLSVNASTVHRKLDILDRKAPTWLRD